MNACLNEKELTRLFVSDAAEMPAARAHVAECAACASRYEELARDARIIAGTIASAAASRATLQEYTAKRAVDGWRSDRPYTRVAGWFAGATAFGAAAAIATMLALGWRPARSPQMATALPAVAKTAPVAYAQDQAGRITFDPISAIAYDEGGSAAAGSGDAIFTSYSGDDGNLLFCAPGDDSGMCAPTAGNRG
jgi:hypothetical protein